MCDTERVKLRTAARELGMSPQGVREHMKLNRPDWDIGVAIDPKISGKTVWEYHIYRSRLDRHLGKIK